MRRRNGHLRRLAALAVALLLPAAGLVANSQGAHAADRYTVALSGAFTDSTNPAVRPYRDSAVVGAVSTATLSFLSVPGASSDTPGFSFQAVCVSPTGVVCPTSSKVEWSFGDGTSLNANPSTGAALTVGPGGAVSVSHQYVNVGRYTLTLGVNGDDGSYGQGRLQVFVGSRYADVDAAYSGGKGVNPDSEAVWAVNAAGLLGTCQSYYGHGPDSSLISGTARTEDPNRAMFCPAPDPALAGGVGQVPFTAANCWNTSTAALVHGCTSRGDFLRALVQATSAADQDDLAAKAANAASAPAPATCPNEKPNVDGRDGVLRAAKLFGADPCNAEHPLTKGEAYQLLYAVLPVAPAPPSSGLSDLNSAPGLTYRTAVNSVLSYGAPLVGTATCASGSGPNTGCFNANEVLTRAQSARLLAFFLLGETADVAALKAVLTADNSQVNLGGVVQLHVSVKVPAWLRPYTANWSVALASTVAPNAATISCAPSSHGVVTLDANTAGFTKTCLLKVNSLPSGGVLPVQLSLNGQVTSSVNLVVINAVPKLNPVSVPTLTEDQAPVTSSVSFSDPLDNPITALQLAASASAPDASWSDVLEIPAPDGSPHLIVRATGVNATNHTGTLSWSPQDKANGPFTLYMRVCNSGQACSSPQAVTGSIAPVNNRPVAYPISGISRTDNLASSVGDCRLVQSAAPTGSLFALRGDDPLDTGRGGYVSKIASYTVTAPAGTTSGTLYVCASNGAWTAVPAGGTGTTGADGSGVGYPVVLYNPSVGAYASVTYSYTVTDGGFGAGGAQSSATPANITITNSAPDAPPSASITVNQVTGATFTTDFIFTDPRTPAPANIVSYAYVYGDGSSTSAQSNPSVTHRYASAGVFTVSVTVTDTVGRTASASTQVTVVNNLIGNPTFEAGTAQWNPATGGTGPLASNTLTPHGGLSSAAVVRLSGGNCQVTHTPPSLAKASKAGAVYASTLWVRPTPESTGLAFTLTVAEIASGTQVGALTANVSLGPANVWQQVPLTYTASGTDNTIVLTTGLAAFSGSACFGLDDVTMTAG